MTRSFYQADAGAKWDVLYHWLVWEQILILDLVISDLEIYCLENNLVGDGVLNLLRIARTSSGVRPSGHFRPWW